LECGEIGERDTNRLGRINAIGDRHEKSCGANCILGVAAGYAEIRDQLALVWRGHAEAGLFDDANEFIARREWQGSFEIRVAAASNEGIGEPGAGGEDFNADLARARLGDARLFGQFENLRAAEPSDANMLPRHNFTSIDIISAQASLSMLRRDWQGKFSNRKIFDRRF
jgi:hypothetical protein